MVEPSAGADIVVLNSCTVTATADAKARQFLRAARRRNPNAVVVATGCYAQRAPAELEGLAAVSLVIGNTGKAELVESAIAALEAQTPAQVAPAAVLEKAGIRPRPNPLPRGEGTFDAPGKGAGRTRAMVKIQEGCDQVCAYCIVPKVRGRERSIPPEEIIAEINRHAAAGCREVALTGTQLGSYGFDLPGASLPRLLERVLAETDVERLRVSSLQAHEITAPLLELWNDRRLMSHFHIPLQSGSDPVLRAMRRRYGTAQFAASVELARRMYPHAGLTTDIIVGFPGETAADFAASRDFAGAMQFSDIHAFPYSSRPGTSAAHFREQVAEPEKRARMQQLLALAAESRRRFRESQLGTLRPALWERAPAGSGVWSGLTDNYLRVRTASGSELGNQITNARLTALDGDWVLAEVIEAERKLPLPEGEG